MKKTLECIDNSPELLVLELTDLSLGVSIFIFMFLLLWAIRIKSVLILKENNISTNFLLDTTILYSSTRERSNVDYMPFY